MYDPKANTQGTPEDGASNAVRRPRLGRWRFHLAAFTYSSSWRSSSSAVSAGRSVRPPRPPRPPRPVPRAAPRPRVGDAVAAAAPRPRTEVTPPRPPRGDLAMVFFFPGEKGRRGGVKVAHRFSLLVRQLGCPLPSCAGPQRPRTWRPRAALGHRTTRPPAFGLPRPAPPRPRRPRHGTCGQQGCKYGARRSRQGRDGRYHRGCGRSKRRWRPGPPSACQRRHRRCPASGQRGRTRSCNG